MKNFSPNFEALYLFYLFYNKILENRIISNNTNIRARVSLEKIRLTNTLRVLYDECCDVLIQNCVDDVKYKLARYNKKMFQLKEKLDDTCLNSRIFPYNLYKNNKKIIKLLVSLLFKYGTFFAKSNFRESKFTESDSRILGGAVKVNAIRDFQKESSNPYKKGK